MGDSLEQNSLDDISQGRRKLAVAVAFVRQNKTPQFLPQFGSLGMSMALTMTLGNDNDLVAIAGNVDGTGWSNQGKGTASSQIKDNTYVSI